MTEFETVDDFESQLAAVCSSGAPAALRDAVLCDVERELRAVRRDRRLMRAAAVLMMIGVGVNVALTLQPTSESDSRNRQIARHGFTDSLVETAAMIACATDIETGRRFARQIARVNGRELTDEEVGAIDAAIEKDRG